MWNFPVQEIPSYCLSADKQQTTVYKMSQIPSILKSRLRPPSQYFTIDRLLICFPHITEQVIKCFSATTRAWCGSYFHVYFKEKYQEAGAQQNPPKIMTLMILWNLVMRHMEKWSDTWHLKSCLFSSITVCQIDLSSNFTMHHKRALLSKGIKVRQAG